MPALELELPEATESELAEKVQVRVAAIRYQGVDLNEYQLEDPLGRELPQFTPGSHIDVYIPGGLVRQYSLCNPSHERFRYLIVVQRDQRSRGGSETIFSRIRVGDLIEISKPRNNFRISDPNAPRHLLLAGGVGITPIISLMYEFLQLGSNFELHYCTRSRERTAFLSELQPFIASGKVKIYHDSGDTGQGLDLASLLSQCQVGTHVYYCGPAGFMESISNHVRAWPRGTVHFEYFAAPPSTGSERVSAGESTRRGFSVRLARTGRTMFIPTGKRILDVLIENGIEIPTMCESGVCGTCRVRFLEGVPDHRDYILDEDEREREILVCCSGARSSLLVLDL